MTYDPATATYYAPATGIYYAPGATTYDPATRTYHAPDVTTYGLPTGTYRLVPGAPAEAVTITPDKVEGNGSPAVQGPTGG